MHTKTQRKDKRGMRVSVSVLINIMSKGWGREEVSSAVSDEAAQTGVKGRKQTHDAGAVTHCLGPAHCLALVQMDTTG